LLAARWTDGPLYGLAVTNRYDPVYGRDRLFLDGLATPLVQDYRFSSTTGRLNVVSNGLYSVSYGYLANSDLIQTTTGKSNTTAVLTATRIWDFGYRLRSIQNTAGSSIVSSHSYLYDEVDRRTQATLADSSSREAGGGQFERAVVAGGDQLGDVEQPDGDRAGQALDPAGGSDVPMGRGREPDQRPGVAVSVGWGEPVGRDDQRDGVGGRGTAEAGVCV
jgi:hypothetical protein